MNTGDIQDNRGIRGDPHLFGKFYVNILIDVSYFIAHHGAQEFKVEDRLFLAMKSYFKKGSTCHVSNGLHHRVSFSAFKYIFDKSQHKINVVAIGGFKQRV